jgi:hypothetical protein
MSARPADGVCGNRRIDDAVHRFKAEWAAGRKPRIEDVLGPPNEATNGLLFRALLAVELGSRHKHGDKLSTADYKKRFPQRTADVLFVFREFADWLKSGSRETSVRQESVRVGEQPAQATARPKTEVMDLVAVLADDRRQMLATVDAAVRKRRKPWWVWLAGAGGLGILVAVAVLAFVRTPTATVVLNLGVDLADATLSYFLDARPIGAEALAGPIDLPVGRHELTVNRGPTVLRRFEFEVARGGGPNVALVELPPPLSDDPDRAAAELVQLLGGSVALATQPTAFYGPHDDLPVGPCKPVWVKLGSRVPSPANLEVLSHAAGIRGLELGSGPADGWQWLADRPALEQLVVEGRGLTEDDLAQIGKIGGLKSLTLSGPHVDDRSTKHLRGLARLEVLNLSGSVVGNVTLANLAGLPLKELSLAGTRVTNAGVATLENLKTLRRLDVTDSKINNDGIANLIDRLPECWVTPALVIPAGLAATIADLEAKLARNPTGFNYGIHNGLRHNYWLAKEHRKQRYHREVIFRNSVMDDYTLRCACSHSTDKEVSAQRLIRVAESDPENRCTVAACHIRAAELMADKAEAKRLFQSVIDTPGKDLNAYRAEARKRLAALK